MKRLLKFSRYYIVATMLMLLCISCDKMKEYAPGVDKASITECIDATLNPLMTSVNEVMLYHTNFTEEYEVNKVFCEMPPETVRNIATVLIKNNGSVMVKEIVYEYKANKQIYDNLPLCTGSPSQESTHQQPDLPLQPTAEISTISLPPATTTTRVEDDTVNGIPLKVTIKEERRYEQK